MFVNKTNQADLKALSFKTPVFILFHSQHCGHCKRVYPTWTELMTTYENDTDVITAESECVNNRETCNFFMKVNGYPTFSYIVNGIALEVNVRRTLPDFIKFVEHLKLYDPKIPCKLWMNQLSSYPIFIFRSPSNYSDVCDMALNFTHKKLGNTFFIDAPFANATSNDLEIKFDKSHQIVFANLTDNNIIDDLINEHRVLPLGDWNVRSALVRNIKRRLIVLLFSEKRHINQYLDLAYNQAEHFLFAKINISAFMKAVPDIDINVTDVPSLLIADSTKSKFLLKKNVLASEKSLVDELKQINDEDFDVNMSFSYDLLIPTPKQVAAKNEQIQEEESTSMLAIIFIIIFSIILVVLILIIGVGKVYDLNNSRRRNHYLYRSMRRARSWIQNKFYLIASKFGFERKDVLL